jgi:hypothetical protein
MTQSSPPPKLGQYAIPDTFLQMTAWSFVAPADWTRTGGAYWTGRLLPLAYYSDLQYYQDYSGRIYGSNDPTDFYLQTKIGGTVLESAR